MTANTEHWLGHLLKFLEGWEVAAVIPYDDVTELRLVGRFESELHPAEARGRLWLSGEPDSLVYSPVGAKLGLSSDGITAGDWKIADSRLVAGQLLDWAIVYASDASVDPVVDPVEAADAIVRSGTIVWPTMVDDPDASDGLGHLEGLIRLSLLEPSLVVSMVVEQDSASGVVFDLFVTPYGVVETGRLLEDDRGMVVSMVPLGDLPSRLLERTGVGRLLGPGDPPWADRSVSVRSTYMDEEGLVAGALAWEESSSGKLFSPEGTLRALSVASELLGMLPGGGVAGSDEFGKRTVTGV